MLEILKKIIDKVQAPTLPDDLAKQYKLLGITSIEYYSGTVVHDQLLGLISSGIGCDVATEKKIHLRVLDELNAELVHRAVLLGEAVENYITIVNILKTSLLHIQEYLITIEDNETWRRTILFCKLCALASPGVYGLIYNDIRESFPREYDVAISVRFLEDRGCRYSFENGKLKIISGIEEVAIEMEMLIKNFGGANLMMIIFQYLNILGRYNQRFERFDIYRTASMMVSDQRRQIPYGYLLHLCLKYPQYKVPAAVPAFGDNPHNIFEFAKLLCQGAYDVQVYNRWQFMARDGGALPDLARQVVLWDNMYSVAQARMTLSLSIINDLFNCVNDRDFERTLGFTMMQLQEFCAALDATCGTSHGPSILSKTEIYRQLPLLGEGIVENLLICVAHPLGFNNKYTLADDASSNEYFKKPLIKLDHETYMIPQRSWAAPNYFEAILSQLRKGIDKIDQKIGPQIERLLIERFRLKGFKVANGNYSYDGVKGEVDVLIETADSIVIIECKKKNLTRTSKSGTAEELLFDLSDSLLSAHLQTGRLELILREANSLTFSDKFIGDTVVELNGRQLIRIALTLSDYGGFHDAMVMENFLNSMLTHSFWSKTGDGRVVIKFEELEKKRINWVRQYQKIKKLKTFVETMPFRNVMFMNLVQLLELLEDSDALTFVKNLTNNMHMSYGTMDWYMEQGLISKLKDQDGE